MAVDSFDAVKFRRALLAWYARHRRDLPWRRTRDPYLIWLSEVILQQTRVDQGLPYYERFRRAFPTVQALAAAPEQDVLKQWEGLGYYARARNFHRAARIVAGERAGVFPQTAEEWLSLPGVGRYTAGAIASIAFDDPAPIVDGNVARVLSRLYDLADSIDAPATKSHLWDIAERLTPRRNPGAFNQAMMELGARVCVPAAPDCPACPVRGHCAAHAAGTVPERPVRAAKKPVPHVDEALAVIERRGRYLLRQRPPDGLLGGLWEFPSVQPDDTAALAAMIQETFGLKITIERELTVVRHAFSHFKVTVHVYQCQCTGRCTPGDDSAWVTAKELRAYPLPKTHHKFIDFL